MKNIYISYTGNMTVQRLLVEDSDASLLEQRAFTGEDRMVRVTDHRVREDDKAGSKVLVRPSSIASIRVGEPIVTPDAGLPPVDVQAVADRMRVIGVDYARSVCDRVPVELGALRHEEALAVLKGWPEASKDARVKVAAALDMDENWLL